MMAIILGALCVFAIGVALDLCGQLRYQRENTRLAERTNASLRGLLHRAEAEILRLHARTDRSDSMVSACMTRIDEQNRMIAHDKSEVMNCVKQMTGRGFKNKAGPLERSKVFARLERVVQRKVKPEPAAKPWPLPTM